MHKRPVNKSLDKLVIKNVKKKKLRKQVNYKTNKVIKNVLDKNVELPRVSIVVCTMRPKYMNNVFSNYSRQMYDEKEMIIVLNNNNMDLNKWKEKTKQYKNISVFQLDEKITLGNCLNYGINQSKHEIIAKFDDDDYYGPKYLLDSVKAFKYTDAGVVGKATSYVYFKKSEILAIRFPNRDNRFVTHMDGPTMLIKREVFKKVKFANIPRGVDTRFSKDCVRNGIKIYSINKFHHVYIRHKSAKNHTWKISDKNLLTCCKIIRRNIKNYTEYVDI